ncbi:SDR family NAD(P)-dependent oxidoreductase [Sciscionella marina]|uniref:SDR family NAD(P)-dependent oxidoreductase n=1 Tax=Sciscionella marina TaxID=508770 RepID=UPI00037A824A|nr:SDR family oxidoreductase [Sciscionella marina]
MPQASRNLLLSGKTAVVTGGSRGVGRATVTKLAAWGARVYFSYGHSAEAAERTVRELSGTPEPVTAIHEDLSEVDAPRAVLDRVHAEHGALDIFVHNVSSWHQMSALAPKVEEFHADFAVSTLPLLRVAERLGELLTDKTGRLVAVSSSGARGVVPGYASLGMAKAALESLARYLAVEFAPRDISVNVVSAAKLDKADGTVPEQLLRQLLARTPTGRLTTPEEVADTIALLCLPEAGWLHGQVLTVDGGLALRA